MVIRVADIVPAADTSAQGVAVHGHLIHALRGDGIVVLSFAGITSATSSFVNACFVDLLDAFSLADIKRRLKVVESSRQINDMIKSRLTHEGRLTHA